MPEKKPFLYIRIVLTAIFYFICEDDPVLEIVKNLSNVLGIQGGSYASRIILEQRKKKACRLVQTIISYSEYHIILVPDHNKFPYLCATDRLIISLVVYLY